MKTFAKPLVLLVLIVMVPSCGGKSASNGTSSSAAASASSATMSTVSKYDAGPRAGESPADEELAEQGEKLFQSKGCSACHTFGKRLTGPDLAGVSMRRTSAWIENQILHPEVMVKEDPISHGLFAQYALQMPNQGVKPEEAKAIIEHFKHLDHEAGLAPAATSK